MGRQVRDYRLDNRTTRLKLAVRLEPYWRLLSEGAHLGYYRGARVGKWVARFRRPGAAGGYLKTTLGEADDIADADGDRFLSNAEAQAKAHAWFAKVAGGAKPVGNYTVSDALDDYMKGFGGKSVAATRSRIDAIIRPALGNHVVAKLDAKIVRDWHRERGRSAARLRTGKSATEQNVRETVGDEAIRRRRSTANRDLTVLKAALNRAAEDRPGAFPIDAWASVKPFAKADGAKLRYLSDDEARRLVNACASDFRSIVQASLLTGGRWGELCSVVVRDFDRQGRVLWIMDAKSGKPRPCFLEGEGVSLFEQLTAGKKPAARIFTKADGKPWGSSHQRRPMLDASAAAKVEIASFHDLRRTYGARMALSGVPMAVIAEAMGHADERITRRHYAHLSPSYVSDTVRAAVGGMGIVEASNVVRLG